MLMSQLTYIVTGKTLQYYFIPSVEACLDYFNSSEEMYFTSYFLESCLCRPFSTLQNIFWKKYLHKRNKYICIYNVSKKGEGEHKKMESKYFLG